MKLLKAGDRIRLKTRTISGWKGTGTVTVDQSGPDTNVRFRPDDIPRRRADDALLNYRACRHEIAVLRKQR